MALFDSLTVWLFGIKVSSTDINASKIVTQKVMSNVLELPRNEKKNALLFFLFFWLVPLL